MEYPFTKALADNPSALTVAVYRYLIEAVPQLGRVPTPLEAGQELAVGRKEVTKALRELASHGALRLDAATHWISEVYPYSATKTKHEVVFDNGTRVYCMCAIDCFYVPFLTASDIIIHSTCQLCGCDIEIRLERCRLSQVNPSWTVVWDSDAPYDCPTTNFFCSEAHLRGWREVAPGDPGSMRSLAEALERGRLAASAIRQVIAAP